MWQNPTYLAQEIESKWYLQILFDACLWIPNAVNVSYLQLSFQLPPITSVLARLFIHNFFLFSPFLSLHLFVSHISITSPLLFFLFFILSSLMALLPSPVVPLVFCPQLSAIITSFPSFSSTLSLTNIPSTSCPALVIPPLLNPYPWFPPAANPFPPDVARFCGCEERCSDSEMCQSAES